MMNVSLLCPWVVPSTRSVCRFPFDLQPFLTEHRSVFLTPKGRCAAALICVMWLWHGRVSSNAAKRLRLKRVAFSLVRMMRWRDRAFSLRLVGRWHQSSCFVAKQTSSLRCAIALLTHPVISDAGEANERKRSLGEKTLVTLTSRAMF